MSSTPSRLTNDVTEQIRVTGGGGGGGNVNITGINGSPPALGNPLPVELSDGTNAFGTVGNPLNVNVVSGGTSGVQYTDSPVVAPGATVSTLAAGYDGANVRPVLVTSSGQLSIVGLVQTVADGTTGAAVPAFADYGGINIGGTLRGQTGFGVGAQFAVSVAIVDGAGNQITSFGGGTQYADGTTQATPTGTVALGKNPANILHSLALDTLGYLESDILAAVYSASPTGYTQLVSDSFFRANENPLIATNWTTWGDAFVVSLLVNGNQAQDSNIAGNGGEYWNPTQTLFPSGPNLGQYAQATIAAIESGGEVAVVCFSGTTLAAKSYLFTCLRGGGSSCTLTIFKNSSVPIAGPLVSTLIGNDVLRLEVYNGVVTAYFNGTAVLTVADSTNTTGQPGLYIVPNSSVTLTGAINFSAGTIALPPPLPGQAVYTGINVAGAFRGQTGFSVGSQFAEAVAIVDASGNQITSFGATTAIGSSPTVGSLSLGLTPAGIAKAMQLDQQSALLVKVSNTNPVEHYLEDPDTGALAKVDDDGNAFVRVQAFDESLTPNFSLVNWGSPLASGGPLSPATSTAAVGTEIAPIVRPIQRRVGAIVTTVPLGISASYIGPWIDTNQTGDNYVAANSKSDQNGANPALNIDSTDDLTNSNSLNFGVGQVQAFAGSLATLQPTQITQRYWRIRYVNAGTAQTTFELTVIAFSSFPTLSTSSNFAFSSANAIVTQLNMAQSNFLDSLATNAALSPIGVKASSSFGPMFQAILPYIYNGTTAAWDRLRTPITYNTAQVRNAGSTSVWTPAVSKKFRLMRYQIQLTDNVSQMNGGIVTLTFYDGSLIPLNLQHDFYIPAAPAGGSVYQSPWIDLGNGILSNAINNVLIANLSNTLTNGNIRINVCGSEE
jgi:hypothetical protein